jgi:hypothetical protein
MIKNKKIYILMAAILCFSFFTAGISSCKTKEGCGYEEKMAPKTDKHGRLSTKKGKSRLFE